MPIDADAYMAGQIPTLCRGGSWVPPSHPIASMAQLTNRFPGSAYGPAHTPLTGMGRHPSSRTQPRGMIPPIPFLNGHQIALQRMADNLHHLPPGYARVAQRSGQPVSDRSRSCSTTRISNVPASIGWSTMCWDKHNGKQRVFTAEPVYSPSHFNLSVRPHRPQAEILPPACKPHLPDGHPESGRNKVKPAPSSPGRGRPTLPRVYSDEFPPTPASVQKLARRNTNVSHPGDRTFRSVSSLDRTDGHRSRTSPLPVRKPTTSSHMNSETHTSYVHPLAEVAYDLHSAHPHVPACEDRVSLRDASGSSGSGGRSTRISSSRALPDWYRPLGYPKETRSDMPPINRDGPAMRTHGVPWTSEVVVLPNTPEGPRWMVARPPRTERVGGGSWWQAGGE